MRTRESIRIRPVKLRPAARMSSPLSHSPDIVPQEPPFRQVGPRPASQEGLDIVERPFTVDEAKAAREAFITAATNIVMPVISIDGHPVGGAVPGPITKRLRARFHAVAESVGA